jgi:transcriptional regulator with XRE-family HTH domain
MGARLAWARKVAGLATRDLDKLAGLTPGHTASIEAGRRPNPSVRTVLALARVLGVTCDWLIDGSGALPSRAALRALTKP